MSNKLKQIIEDKKEFLNLIKKKSSLDFLEKKIKNLNFFYDFKEAIENNKKVSLISEIKKASPSAGILVKNFNHLDIAKIFIENGSTCLSVLTEEKYFLGKLDYITDIKNKFQIPILAKDFFIDPYQIALAKSYGCDCILLIMAALTIDEAILLEKEAIDFGMDVLVETHTQEEILKANKLKTNLVGINNRNLKTMEVDINNSLRLKEFIDPNKIIVAESGLKTYSDLKLLKKGGIQNFLIGESLMKEQDLTSATKRILGLLN